MKEKFSKLREKLNELIMTGEHKEELLDSVEALQKDYERMEFLHRQYAKDKAVTIHLLENTLKELQKQRDNVAEKNNLLELQKQQLEEQSEKLSKSLHALQLSYHELEQFAFIASHDLKSPLRNIGGYAQLLKKRYYGKLNEEADTFLDFIVKNTQMMHTVITHLLEYSTINHNREITLTDMNKVVDLICYNMREAIEKSQANIEFEPLPQLWVQKNGITQVLQHLIENSIKFRSDKIPYIQIKVEQLTDDSTWQFSVKDNGLGLSEQYQEKVFYPFQRIDSRHLPGEGMGLAICLKIVKMHGGSIWFKENTEGGTTFYFTIPQMNIEQITQPEIVKAL